jgi:hypothetical protein
MPEHCYEIEGKTTVACLPGSSAATGRTNCPEVPHRR